MRQMCCLLESSCADGWITESISVEHDAQQSRRFIVTSLLFSERKDSHPPPPTSHHFPNISTLPESSWCWWRRSVHHKDSAGAEGKQPSGFYSGKQHCFNFFIYILWKEDDSSVSVASRDITITIQCPYKLYQHEHFPVVGLERIR